jgi:hypothetical protein
MGMMMDQGGREKSEDVRTLALVLVPRVFYSFSLVLFMLVFYSYLSGLS